MPKKVGEAERQRLLAEKFREEEYTKASIALREYSQSIKGMPKLTKKEIHENLRNISNHPDADEDSARQYLAYVLNPIYSGKFNPKVSRHNPISLRDAYDLYQELAEMDKKRGYHTGAASEYARAGWIAQYAHANDTAKKLLKKAGEEEHKHLQGLDSQYFVSADRAPKEIERNNKEILRRHKVLSATLEGKLTLIIAIGGILAGLFFLSTNITGNTISNMTNSTSNIIGALLLVIGLIAGFFWMRKK